MIQDIINNMIIGITTIILYSSILRTLNNISKTLNNIYRAEYIIIPDIIGNNLNEIETIIVQCIYENPNKYFSTTDLKEKVCMKLTDTFYNTIDKPVRDALTSLIEKNLIKKDVKGYRVVFKSEVK